MCTAPAPTIALHLMQHLCAALASSAAGFVYRATQDRLIGGRKNEKKFIMSAALVHSTCADNCFALDAAFVCSTCFQCSRLRISRFTGLFDSSMNTSTRACSRLRISHYTVPFDSSMDTSTRAHSDIRIIHADTVEHASLGVQQTSYIALHRTV